MDIFHVFYLFGGLALFLFGMDLMGKALEQQAGGKLQKILSTLTSNRFMGLLLGLAVTAVIQSSSATTVMVVGFVNSGIMALRQAIGVILGSNIGTTATSWILSLSGVQGDSFWLQMLKPTSFSPILALIGIILYMFCKSEKKKGIGTILLGFSILMTGMSTMSSAVEPLAEEAWFTSLFVRFTNPILGLLAGRPPHRRDSKLQRQCGHPAGAQRNRRHHLCQRHSHHSGAEHRHLYHRNFGLNRYQ